MTKVAKRIVIASCCAIIFAASICVAILLTRQTVLKEVGLVSDNYFTIAEEPRKIEGFVNKYESFLPDEKAEFICKCCEDFNIDSDLAVAILQVENPTLKENATSKPNENGSRDTGLFQLNDISLYRRDGFLEKFWPKEFGEFNTDNWKHNTYIAIRYIKDLQLTFGENNIYFIAAGYNAGTSRAYDAYINGAWRLPSTTQYSYAPSVENNYKEWKRIS